MRKFLTLGLVVMTVILAGAGLLVYVIHKPSIIPAPVAKQVHFAIFYPDSTKQFPVIKNSIHYDSSSGVLGYTVMIDGRKTVINQQAEPEAFKDAGSDAALYQKMLDKMHQYQEFNATVGKVTMTHPEELRGLQAAVMDQKGTLLFAQPEGDVSPDQWKMFFNSLKVLNQ